MNMNSETSRYIKFGVYMVAVILINIVGLTIFFRIDLTGNKVYSLSKVSKKVVSTLSEPLTINVFFTGNLPAPYNTVERYLSDLLGEYAIYGGNNFNYRFYDVTPEEEGGTGASTENQKMAQDYGLNPVQIQAIEKDEVQFKKAYMGLVILHGDMMERIPTITSTDGLEYKITSSIMKLNNKISALLKLKAPVEVKLYMSPSLRDVAPYMGLKDMPGLPSQIKDIVQKLNKKMYDRLVFTVAEPADLQDIDRLAKTYNLMHLKWPDLKGTNVKGGEGVIGLVLHHGRNTAVLPPIQVYRIPLFGTRYNFYRPDELEAMISQNAESLIGINEEIGYLEDHGTLKTFAMPGAAMKEPITVFDQLASQNYSLKKISLADGIPKGLKSLIIAGPTEAFTENELYQIDQALMQGTNLALFLDKFQEVQYGQPGNPFAQQSQFVPINTGLEKLLNRYGLKINSSIAMDEKCFKQRLPVEYGGGQQDVYFAPIIQGKHINSRLEYMKNIKSLIMLVASPLQVDEKLLNENRLKALKLFSTSDRSWEMRDNIMLNPAYIKPPASEKEMSSKALAYLLEGTFTSAYAGKPAPEKQSATVDPKDTKTDTPGQEKAAVQGIEATGSTLARSAKPGKIFVIGSSMILGNNLLESDGQSPNSTFIMNMLDVLNDHVDIALMRSKTLTINPLDDIQPQIKMLVKTLNIAGVPALVVLSGLLVWVRRRMRKKRIEMMFARRTSS